MYLSKVTMISSPQTAHELAKLQRNGVYASHQLIWQLFSSDTKRSFLYREEMGATGMPEFYVLSKTEPQVISPIFSCVTKVFEPKLDKGQQLSFKLRVNPTVCVKGEDGKQRRHDVMMQAKYNVKDELSDAQSLKMHMEQAAISWLNNEKRLDEWGITLDFQPAIDGYTQHKVQKKRHQIQFSSVDYQGMLTVQYPQKFINQYAKGFGRAKGMGCGLMMIKRA
tara:strand:- start:83 stop:751 length:669 start_codon:yes stop_codon:yes gene_type:complete